jgi:hypothetical protein
MVRIESGACLLGRFAPPLPALAPSPAAERAPTPTPLRVRSAARKPLLLNGNTRAAGLTAPRRMLVASQPETTRAAPWRATATAATRFVRPPKPAPCRSRRRHLQQGLPGRALRVLPASLQRGLARGCAPAHARAARPSPTPPPRSAAPPPGLPTRTVARPAPLPGRPRNRRPGGSSEVRLPHASSASLGLVLRYLFTSELPGGDVPWQVLMEACRWALPQLPSWCY